MQMTIPRIRNSALHLKCECRNMFCYAFVYTTFSPLTHSRAHTPHTVCIPSLPVQALRAIWLMVLLLVPCVLSIWVENTTVSAALLCGGVITSRLGLWSFDIAITQIQQESIKAEERGVVGAVQNSVQQVMYLLHFGLAIVFSTPDQVRASVCVCVCVCVEDKKQGRWDKYRDVAGACFEMIPWHCTVPQMSTYPAHPLAFRPPPPAHCTHTPSPSPSLEPSLTSLSSSPSPLCCSPGSSTPPTTNACAATFATSQVCPTWASKAHRNIATTSRTTRGNTAATGSTVSRPENSRESLGTGCLLR